RHTFNGKRGRTFGSSPFLWAIVGFSSLQKVIISVNKYSQHYKINYTDWQHISPAEPHYLAVLKSWNGPTDPDKGEGPGDSFYCKDGNIENGFGGGSHFRQPIAGKGKMIASKKESC